MIEKCKYCGISEKLVEEVMKIPVTFEKAKESAEIISDYIQFYNPRVDTGDIIGMKVVIAKLLVCRYFEKESHKENKND